MGSGNFINRLSKRLVKGVGCCHRDFPIAVIDFDAVMTGTSRPKRVIYGRPLYGKAILQHGVHLCAIKRPSRPSALREATLRHGVHPSAKTCRWVPPFRKSAQKLKVVIQGASLIDSQVFREKPA
jgi:hypothetical protein